MTLYDEINALGGEPFAGDLRSAGRMENLDTVLAILDRRGLGPDGPTDDQLRQETDDILASLDWQEVRPEVRAFALLMEKQLKANDHKSGWKDDDPKALIGRLIDETHELIDVANTPATRPRAALKRMGQEAADVANFAMMIADVCGALGETK
ncbi:hypothetical protein [Sphingomonas albertensis]|uniref:hypothetical protein n=1 Tax=Sphingomonas albertensis TaxID=2762591 RepID=UPI0037D9EE09